MTLHPTPKTSSPSTSPLDPITASRFAHAASREVSGNLFRLLAEMSAEEQPAIATLGGGDGGDDDRDLGPPWDESQTEALTTAAASAPDTAKLDAA